MKNPGQKLEEKVLELAQKRRGEMQARFDRPPKGDQPEPLGELPALSSKPPRGLWQMKNAQTKAGAEIGPVRRASG